MIVKIQDFGYDVSITDPVSDEASLLFVQITVNGQMTSWPVTGQIVEVEYLVGDDLSTLNVEYVTSDRAVIEVDDTNTAERLVTVQSESGTVTTEWTVVFNEISDLNSDTIRLYQLIETSTGILCVLSFDNQGFATARLPYVDNSITYLDVLAETNFVNQTDLELLAYTENVDPDGYDLFGSTLTAFTLAEQTLLDSNFVYAKITRIGATDVYIKLVKQHQLMTSDYVETIKRKFSDKWCQLFMNRLVTDLILNAEQLMTLESATDFVTLKELLQIYQIDWYDISNMQNQFIDMLSTSNMLELSTIDLQLSNEIAYEGLTSAQIERLDKSFAQWIYDELVEHANADMYQDTLTWLHWLWNDEFHICTEDLEQSRLAYMNQAGINVLLMLSRRLLSHMLTWLQYVETMKANKIAEYNIDSQRLTASIYALQNVINVKTTYQFNGLSMQNSKTFFDSIESLQKSTQILAIGDW